MSAFGGDVIEISFNNPIVGSGYFYPKSGETATVFTGGFTNEAIGTAGDGSAIIKKIRKGWEFEIMCRWDMNNANDFTQYRALEESTVETEFTFTISNGTVWSGKGVPQEGNSGNMGDATFTAKLAGGGHLIRIV